MSNETYLTKEQIEELYDKYLKETPNKKPVTSEAPVDESKLSTLIPPECLERFFEGLSRVQPVEVETDIMDDHNLPDAVDLRKWAQVTDNQGPDGLCHDASTEVLTDRGWKCFQDLDGEEKLASVDPDTQKMIFEKPTRLVGYEYKGPMIRGRHKFLDFLVTPDHEMLVRPWDSKNKRVSDKYEFTAAKDLGWYSGLMSRVVYEGGDDSDTYILKETDRPVPMEPFLKFLGLFLADGSLLHTDRGYRVQLAGKKDRKRALIADFAPKLGLTINEYEDRVHFSDKGIYTELERLGLLGVKAPQKFVPEFVFSLSKRNIEHFLFGHFTGDGHESPEKKAHYTSSSRLAEDLQRLIFLTGSMSNIVIREPREASQIEATGQWVKGKYPEHKVSVCDKMNLSIDRNEHISTEEYDGMVFCAEVPTYHTLVTRRNGYILIAGNCTAYATIGYLAFKIAKETGKKYDLSEHYHWSNYKQYNSMSASQALTKFWQGEEKLWPDYSTAGKPGWDESRFAALKSPRELRSITEIKKHLARGEPVVLSIGLDTAYWNTPIIYGDRGTQKSGHALLIVGYLTLSNGLKVFIVQNSWGLGWGDKGYCYIVEQYLWGDRFWTNAIVFDDAIVWRPGKEPKKDDTVTADIKAVAYPKYKYSAGEREHTAYGIAISGKDRGRVKSVTYETNKALPAWEDSLDYRGTVGTWAAAGYPIASVEVTLDDGKKLKLSAEVP